MNTDLLSRIPDWTREAEVFEQKAHALRQMIEAVLVLNGDANRLFAVDVAVGGSRLGVNQYPTNQGPRGREAVRQITAERPGEWLVKDIKQVNRHRRWPSNDASIETAVVRMAKDGEATKIRGRKGLYRFGTPTESVPRGTGAGANEEVRPV